MKRYWQHMVNSTEKRVEVFLKKQVNDPARADRGRMDSDVVEGKASIYVLTDALCLYFSEESKYYKDAALFAAVERGVSFVERWQRPDGSLDFPTCNFYSAPDTAFCFRRLYGAWEILKKYGTTEAEKALEERYLRIVLRCAPIIICGGFHTPNHRWAVLAALLTLEKLVAENGALAMETVDFSGCTFPHAVSADALPGEPAPAPVVASAQELLERIRVRAGQYLAEGIDGDADGEYAERSTGNYNSVVDKSLITAYEMSGDETYLGYVERNLDMMLYYFDGDDTIFTQNSTRQDQGKALHPDQYFYLYTYMAAHTGSDLFDAAAHKIIKDNLERGDDAPDCIYIFMLYDRLKNYTFRGYGFLPEYRRYFPGSQVLRVKKPSYVYSVLNKKSQFLFVKFGSLPVCVRIGEAYCDVRYFVPERTEDTGDGCVLRGTARGWYYEPWAQDQGTTDWWAMDHKKRERVITSQVDTTVTVKELERGIAVTVKTEGLSGLPLRVEVIVPAGSTLETDSVSLSANRGDSLILRNGYLHLHAGAQKLSIGPGYGTHSFKGHYSGEEKNEAGYSIYLNDYTPYERTFTIVEE